MSTITNQQFEGKTIEEALSAAVDALGDDLEILDAQRVRRRSALGLRRKPVFEVVASKRSLAEPRDFEDVLKRMTERVDEAERELGSPVEQDRRWWKDADFVVPERPAGVTFPNPLDGADIELDVRTEPALRTHVPQPQQQAVAATVASALAPPPAPPAPTVVVEPVMPIDLTAPAWSHDALLALDLPEAMINRLPAGLDGDLEWVAALAKAIGDLLETAECISGPCELTGHGADSAVQLIRGACDGFRLDSLIIDGRRVPATPTELALAIRALLREDEV